MFRSAAAGRLEATSDGGVSALAPSAAGAAALVYRRVRVQPGPVRCRHTGGRGPAPDGHWRACPAAPAPAPAAGGTSRGGARTSASAAAGPVAGVGAAAGAGSEGATDGSGAAAAAGQSTRRRCGRRRAAPPVAAAGDRREGAAARHLTGHTGHAVRRAREVGREVARETCP